MLKFVHNIRNKIIGLKNALIYLHYKVGESLQAFNEILKSCPVRDEIWVERTNHPLSYRAVRYGIWRKLQQNALPTANHVAYLRHAMVCSSSSASFSTHIQSLWDKLNHVILTLKPRIVDTE